MTEAKELGSNRGKNIWNKKVESRDPVPSFL
jgi:hypothetical protein